MDGAITLTELRDEVITQEFFDWGAHQGELECFARDGKSAAAVARHFGVSRNAVLGRAHRTGVKFFGKPPKRERKPKPSLKYGTGWTAERREVARERFLRMHAEGKLQNGSAKSREFRLEALALHFSGFSAARVADKLGCYSLSVYNWRADEALAREAKGIAARAIAAADAARALREAEQRQKAADRKDLIDSINTRILTQLAASHPRIADFARRYLAGERTPAIATKENITRERVSQILAQAKGFGMVLEGLRRSPSKAAPRAARAPRPPIYPGAGYQITEAERDRRRDHMRRVSRAYWDSRRAQAGG